jgi:hypothetical protein
MQRLEVSRAVRPIYESLGVKRLKNEVLLNNNIQLTKLLLDFKQLW